MAIWKTTLYLSDVWSKTDDGELPINTLAKIIADRLQALGEFSNQEVEDEKQFLVENFQHLSQETFVDCEDFDEEMSRLYDWADIPLDNNCNGKKVCWIKTF